jgi:hypothetical protein
LDTASEKDEHSVENPMFPPIGDVRLAGKSNQTSNSMSLQPSSSRPKNKATFGLAPLLEELGIADDCRRKYTSAQSPKTAQKLNISRERCRPRFDVRPHAVKSTPSRKAIGVQTGPRFQKLTQITDQHRPNTPVSTFESPEPIRKNRFNRYLYPGTPAAKARPNVKEPPSRLYKRNTSPRDRPLTKDKQREEGVRNALGNLENRLKGSRQKDRPLKEIHMKEEEDSSEDKGFPTMVEDLLNLSNKGINHS